MTESTEKNSLIKLPAIKVQTLAKKRLRELTEHYTAKLAEAFANDVAEFNAKVDEHNKSQAKFEKFFAKFLPKSWAAKIVNYNARLTEEDALEYTTRVTANFKMAVAEHIVYGWEFLPHGELLCKAAVPPSQAWPRLYFLANLEINTLESPGHPSPIFYLSVDELMILQGK